MTVPPDPRFPNRPAHPHFSRLVQLAKDLDQGHGETMGRSRPLPQVDNESLAYYAQQRGIFASQFLTTSTEPQKISAAWLDGFMFGCLYEHRFPSIGE